MHCSLTRQDLYISKMFYFFLKKKILQNYRKVAKPIPNQFIFEGNECEKQQLLAKAEKTVFNTERQRTTVGR